MKATALRRKRITTSSSWQRFSFCKSSCSTEEQESYSPALLFSRRGLPAQMNFATVGIFLSIAGKGQVEEGQRARHRQQQAENRKDTFPTNLTNLDRPNDS